MCLTLVAKEVPSNSSSVDVPLEVKNFLDDFDARHAKWVEFLNEYSFVINHHAGIENKVEDALSRLTIILHRMNAHVIGFDRLKDEYCRDRELFVVIGNARPRVTTEFLYRDRALPGAVEAPNDREPLACYRVCDCAHEARDRLNSVHGVLYCLSYCSWILFMDIVKKIIIIKVQNFNPRELGFHKYSTCPDFGIIYDEVSNGNRHEYIEFLVENCYWLKVTKLCIPQTSFRDLLICEMHASGLVRQFGRDKTILLVEDRFY